MYGKDIQQTSHFCHAGMKKKKLMLAVYTLVALQQQLLNGIKRPHAD